MAEYNVGGLWHAHQSNGFIASFNIQQVGTELRGIASHSGGSVNGTGQGSVHGDKFLFTVRWSNGSIGEYSGTFSIFGIINGRTFDVNRPSSWATWKSSKWFRRS